MNSISKYAREVCKCLFIFESECKNHNFDLNIFYHNLKTLKANKSNIVDIILNKLCNRVGWYSVANNKINYNENDDSMHIIFHEILHMASGIKDKVNNIFFYGFSQKTKDKAIGDGLNEGYTELLTQRFFDDKSATYLIETAVARMCQEIIGQEKMTQLYFKADLKGLIDEFCKYAERKEVLDFLINLDFLSKYKEKKDNTLAIKENLNNGAKIIYEFLIKTYKNKLNLSDMKSWGGEKFIIKCFTNEYTNALDSYKIQIENSDLKNSSLKDKLDKKRQFETIKSELLNQKIVLEEKNSKTK